MRKLILLLLITTLFGCTDFDQAKVGIDGTSVTQRLSKGKHVISASWKDGMLWVLTRERSACETADTLYLESYDGDSESGPYSSRITLIEQ